MSVTLTTTPTQFCWEILRLGDFPPPVPRKGSPYGPDAVCWLCGGPTHGAGWHWRDAIAETFTNPNLAAVPQSTTVCQACAAFASKQSWEHYVRLYPDRSLKTGHAMGWRNYSHVFARPNIHACPFRGGWKPWLLNPPDPPFLFAVSTSGQKHTIFRAAISYSRDHYAVQFEETRILVDRAAFAECLDAFETLYQAGFSKAEIVTGRYLSHKILRAGLLTWRAWEDTFAPWRRQHPRYVELAAFVATRPEPAGPNDEEA